MSEHACPPQEQLQQMLGGSMVASEIEAVESHVESCAACQETLERIVKRVPTAIISPEDVHFAQTNVDDHANRRGPTLHDADESLPTISGVTIDRLLGHGGMGMVYVGQQTEPVKRQVAVKLIRRDVAKHDFIERFRREQALLASVEHPNIARLYDAGQLKGGSPYFVMEFVSGESITKFCKERRLSLRERLTLFLGVCDAVQHLHRKQIVHRDLKPDNILVAEQDGQPCPKVIDFGLAKLIDSPLNHTSDLTVPEAPLGTLRYMSPEQTGGRRRTADLDTMTDVYSLGVILYKLLTAKTPLDQRTSESSSLDEMLVSIREDDPLPPSRYIAKQSDNDHIAAMSTQRERLAREVSHDLDWIVMRALRKQRNERYESVDKLAADIRNYLNDLPVEARPPSSAYLLKKFYRRHRGLVWSVSAALVLLVAGLCGTAYGMFRAWEAERQANAKAAIETELRKEADRLREEERAAKEASEQRRLKLRTAAHMMHSVFEGINPELANAGDAELRQALLLRLKHAASNILDADVGEDNDVLVLKVSLARSLVALGEAKSAIPLLTNAVEEAAMSDTLTVVDRIPLMLTLANAHKEAGNVDAARTWFSRAFEVSESSLPTEHPLRTAMLGYHAVGFELQGDFVKAEEVRRRLLKKLSPFDRTTANLYFDCLSNLAMDLHQQKKYDEAIDTYRAAIAFPLKEMSATHPVVLNVRSNLAVALQTTGEYEKAGRELRSILKLKQRMFSPDSPAIGEAKTNLAVALVALKKDDEAKTLFNEVVAEQKSAVIVLRARIELVALEIKRGGWNDALSERLRTLAKEVEQDLGKDHKLVERIRSMLAGRRARNEQEQRENPRAK